MAEKGYTFVEDAGRGWRRVVPSPLPTRIVELKVVEQLVAAGDVVITVGGGGIPVVETADGLCGVAAVIDKDRSSSKLALDIDADMLVILTAVDRVCINFNKPNQKELAEMNVEEAKQYIAEGHFAPGSMLPKVEACLDFVQNNKSGGTALITSLKRAKEALERRHGHHHSQIRRRNIFMIFFMRRRETWLIPRKKRKRCYRPLPSCLLFCW